MGTTKTILLDDPAIIHLTKKDKRLAKIISIIGPITYETNKDPFVHMVHEIIEQMLSIKAGNAIFNRLSALCDEQITPERIQDLSLEELKSCGMSNSKAEYIMQLSLSVINGSLNFNDLESLTDEDVIQALTQLRGIGNWTAKMYLIFVLDRQDVLPFEDGAFMQTYRWLYKTNITNKQAVINKCKKWKPYSSIAARYFYHALDIGLTKEAFHLFK